MNWKRLFQENYAQLTFVCTAFLLMVTISCLFVSNALQKATKTTVNVALNETEKTIRVYLREPQIVFDDVYMIVQSMLDNGESQEAISLYLNKATSTLTRSSNALQGFVSIYGYIRGEFISTLDLKYGADYIPQQRPWYQLAVRSNGAAYTAPYVDPHSGFLITSRVQELHGVRGDYYGVLSMDIDLSLLMKYATSLQFAEGGYGMIVNQFGYVIAHPQEKYFNRPLKEVGGGYADVSEMLRKNRQVSAMRINTVDDKEEIVFFRKLYNDWYVGVAMPVTGYFADLYFTTTVLITLGIVLTLALCYILLRLSAAKMRSEDENKFKSSFLARMSHEIRTPMNAIIGMAELTLRKELKDDVRENTLIIKDAGEDLLGLINDILDFSKIEEGKLEIVAVEYQMDALISSVINTIRMYVTKKPLDFITNIDSSLPSTLFGDDRKTRQILLNMLSNAVKYTTQGHVCLTIKGSRVEADGIMLTFEVEDTGIGIKEDDVARLFGDFIQLDTQKNKGLEGTGLGLAITRGLCRAMGGDISVQSQYGQGSVFTANILQKVVNSSCLATVKEPKTKNVIVFEPREIYLRSIGYSLENLGVEYALFSKWEDFLAALKEKRYAFAFICSQRHDTVASELQKQDVPPELVLLSDYYEVAEQTDIRTLFMPIYSASIAKILNGEEKTCDETAKIVRMRFIAPKVHALLVDDIATNLKVAMGLLSPYKIQVSCCKSGKRAIELAEKNDYDLIFMDHMMPEMDGIESTKAIRMLGEHCQSVPIIALTANAVTGMKEMFLANGFNDYLAKPIDVSKLDEVIEKWIPEEKREFIS